jgi:GNAT superfamily N-acetyltransferase
MPPTSADVLTEIALRETVRPADRDAVRRLVDSTGFFFPHEIDVAVELVDERLSKGDPSGYFFVFADAGNKTVGYTCYGPIACTVGSYDLFWIAVDDACRGRGLGRRLLAASEACIARAGGRRIYIETSGRPQYEPTRAFYERCGYVCEAVLRDFYAPGDDKCIYVKDVTERTSTM